MSNHTCVSLVESSETNHKLVEFDVTKLKFDGTMLKFTILKEFVEDDE